MQELEITINEIEIQRFDRYGFDLVRDINYQLFKEDRIINQYTNPDTIVLTASYNNIIVGFKVGYGRSKNVFYSAKGGVLPEYRRLGIARKLLNSMMIEAHKLGYELFCYDTFPNRHRGMIILGLNEGFTVTDAKWNDFYQDFQIHLEKKLEYSFDKPKNEG